jgi:hypothetical protein
MQTMPQYYRYLQVAANEQKAWGLKQAPPAASVYDDRMG